MEGFSVDAFRAKVDRALTRAKTILEVRVRFQVMINSRLLECSYFFALPSMLPYVFCVPQLGKYIRMLSRDTLHRCPSFFLPSLRSFTCTTFAKLLS